MATATETKLTEGIQEYIEAIWRVAGIGPAATKALADHLKVAPASVTGMLKRLAALGLVQYRPYGRASLSAKGRRLATVLIRRHRLSERLLTDILGLPWDKVHTEACRFEHLIEGEVEERLIVRLGGVATCPHGHPLNPSDLDKSYPLPQAKTAAAVRVIAIADESAEVLRYLAELGIIPGARLKIIKKEPFADGPVIIEIAGKSHALGRQVAEKIRVAGRKEA
jgi:DtxR family Mn-dependent transcriptional regulator